MASAAESCEHIDIAFGQAGVLLGCSLALEALPPAPLDESLRALGNRLRDSLWIQLNRQPPLADGTELRSLGAAHGWAGYLFALLRWSEASAMPPPPAPSAAFCAVKLMANTRYWVAGSRVSLAITVDMAGNIGAQVAP
jgi:hypothetical protein